MTTRLQSSHHHKPLWSALIVEDEELSQQLLQNYIKKTPGLECVGVCDDALQASSLLHSRRVDILFADVQMPEMSGIDFLKSFQRSHRVLPAVILTTAYSDYALEGYELNVADYLLKPFSFERYLRAVHKATAWLQAGHRTGIGIADEDKNDTKNEERTIPVKDRRREVLIPYDDIIYLESFGNYTKIYTSERFYIANQALKHFAETLPATEFFRIHKTYMIARSQVLSLEKNTIVVGNRNLPIGITYKAHVMALLEH